MLEIARARASWQIRPAELGAWRSVDARFARGQETGVRQRLMDRLVARGGREWRMPASTVVRAPGRAAGASNVKRTGALDVQKGGRSTKLHGLAGGFGNPIGVALTAGRAGDAPTALALPSTVAMTAARAALADRADDGDAILARVAAPDALPLRPPHPGRTAARSMPLSPPAISATLPASRPAPRSRGAGAAATLRAHPRRAGRSTWNPSRRGALF